MLVTNMEEHSWWNLHTTFDIGQTKKVIQAVQLVTAHQGPVGPEGLFLLGQPELPNMSLA